MSYRLTTARKPLQILDFFGNTAVLPSVTCITKEVVNEHGATRLPENTV